MILSRGGPVYSGIYKAQSPQYVHGCNLLQCCKHGNDTSLFQMKGTLLRKGVNLLFIGTVAAVFGALHETIPPSEQWLFLVL